MEKIPQILIEKANELEAKTKEKYPKLAHMVKKCFLNTIETTVKILEDGSAFVITGDIPAMWLRDSAAQLKPYVRYAKDDAELADIIKSVISKYAFYVNLDPYSNAFNEANSGKQFGYKDETDFESGYIWERKYEVDSLCATIYLAYEYYAVTGDKSIFTEEYKNMVETIADVFALEQNHCNSKYYFKRSDCPPCDTLSNNGRGSEVAYTGMTWSGFRPSDDSCEYGYLIPSNMMAVVALRHAAELIEAGYSNNALADRLKKLAAEIDGGIKKYGVVHTDEFGDIYAYETDGMGHYNLMDDANSPSLLSIPYIGYADKTDSIYQNTRKFILSKNNPYYFEGKCAKGIGSPHTPTNYIWHISLVMQILTSVDEAEKQRCLDTIAATDGGTGFMHEGFNVDNPNEFTREWFAWANTLFAQMMVYVTE